MTEVQNDPEEEKVDADKFVESGDEVTDALNRILSLSNAVEDDMNERRERFQDFNRDTVKKSVSWESSALEQPVTKENDSILTSSEENSRNMKLDLNLNEAKISDINSNRAEPVISPDPVLANENDASASWEIEMSGAKSTSNGKPSKRLLALSQARAQKTGEKYIPPRVLVSCNQIAQRKVLDLKRWYVY